MTKSPLDVHARVKAAIQLLKHENPSGRISISDVCAKAGINRANLYASHTDLVDLVHKTWTMAKKSPSGKTEAECNAGLRVELAAAKQRNDALLLLVLEQQAEIESLRRMQPRSKRKI